MYVSDKKTTSSPVFNEDGSDSNNVHRKSHKLVNAQSEEEFTLSVHKHLDVTKKTHASEEQKLNRLGVHKKAGTDFVKPFGTSKMSSINLASKMSSGIFSEFTTASTRQAETVKPESSKSDISSQGITPNSRNSVFQSSTDGSGKLFKPDPLPVVSAKSADVSLTSFGDFSSVSSTSIFSSIKTTLEGPGPKTGTTAEILPASSVPVSTFAHLAPGSAANVTQQTSESVEEAKVSVLDHVKKDIIVPSFSEPEWIRKETSTMKGTSAVMENLSNKRDGKGEGTLPPFSKHLQTLSKVHSTKRKLSTQM